MPIHMDQKKSTIVESSMYHVPNLERALKILELLSEYPQGLTTSHITELLRFPRNSVFRITATLQDFGYLIRDEDTKVFHLSQKLLIMGYAALTETTLVEKALVVMRLLRDRFRETVLLGILHSNKGLVIEEVQGTHTFRFVIEPGRTFHLHTSAPGKAMVAFLPDDEQDNIIQQIDFIRFNDRTIIDKDNYRKVLKQVKQKGYAIDHAEETEGMICIGAPIFNRFGYPIAAIWITGPSIRISAKDFDVIGEEVKKHAIRISRSLGYAVTINNGTKKKMLKIDRREVMF